MQAHTHPPAYTPRLVSSHFSSIAQKVGRRGQTEAAAATRQYKTTKTKTAKQNNNNNNKAYHLNILHCMRKLVLILCVRLALVLKIIHTYTI